MLLHAGVCDSRMWHPLVPVLARDHRVVAYDLRGFGRSPWRSSGPYSHVDDLLHLLDELGIESATLVGASHGAKVAIDAALEHPDRVDALVLVAPAVGGWDWSEELRAYGDREDELVEAGDADGFVELNLRTWVDGPVRDPAAVAPGVRELAGVMQRGVLELDAAAAAAGLEIGPERALDPPAVGRLSDVGAPTLVVLGELDQVDIARIGETLVREIPGARLATVPGTAHLPSLERPEEFAAVAGPFLAAIHGRPLA